MGEVFLLLVAATIGGGLDAYDDQTLSSSVAADAMREISSLLAAEENTFVKELATIGGLDASDEQT
jgi:hypothetical protein